MYRHYTLKLFSNVQNEPESSSQPSDFKGVVAQHVPCLLCGASRRRPPGLGSTSAEEAEVDSTFSNVSITVTKIIMLMSKEEF